jgi:hypothetical protein
MINWAYIAGFMDGEGNILIASNHHYGFSPRITLAQSGDIGVEVLAKIGNWLAIKGIEARIYTEQAKGLSKLPTYRLVIGYREGCIAFLVGVLPYLITKRIEAQDLLRHLKLFPKLPRGGKLSWETRGSLKE